MDLKDARTHWHDRPGIDRLLDALGAEGGAVRFVGGAVRDALLGLPAGDLDMATVHHPDEVTRRLAAAHIKAIPTGLAHGTITAVASGTVVEVTSLRADVSTDGRRATVEFTTDWKADAARRDFTINALYADPRSGELFDYFGGLDDLRDHRVRFIGEPLQRIAEDHLRILRFFRFHARFGQGRAPDAAALAACAARANDLMALSRERIADELLKLLALPAAPATVRLMHDHGIFAPVLPEITAAGLDSLDRLAETEASLGFAPDALRRLAALLPPDPAAAEKVGARLKLSIKQRKRLVLAADRAIGMAPRALAYRLGTEGALDRLLLADRAGDAAQVRDWPVPPLPVKGSDLIARGLEKGPDISRAMKRIEQAWLDNDFPSGAAFDRLLDDALGAPPPA